jgi:iron-sulfur cluster repair protein YtfE (RIC family)
MQTISDYLGSDHQRLDTMLSRVRELVEQREFARAAAQFKEFSHGLNHHIDAEERVLFPAFEERTGLRSGPTQVMRAEHIRIREWMSGVTASLNGSDDTEARRALNMLTDLLTSHNMKEEHILYPMTDGATDAEEREALVRQMKST